MCRLLVLLIWLLSAARAPAAPLRIYGMESKPVSHIVDGRPAGFAVELAQAIQQRLDRHDPIEILPWARANTLAVSEPNVMLLSIVRTPERARHMQFVGPIFTTQVAAFAARGRLEELRRKDPDMRRLRAGARRGSVFVSLPRSLGYNVTDETNTSETGARMLLSRRFDLWFDGEELINGALERAGRQPGDVELAFRLGNELVYFAFSNGTPAQTVRAWADALRDMKRDGSFQTIHQKWLPAQAAPLDGAL